MFKNREAIILRLCDANFSKYFAEDDRNFQDDSKSSFNFVGNICDNGIQNVMSLDADVADSGYDIAYLLAERISSLFKDAVLALFHESFSNDVLCSVRISFTGALSTLEDTDVETTLGPDELCPCLVLRLVIKEILRIMYL